MPLLAWISQEKEDGSDAIGAKARSTAEEFLRQAKEKAESVKEMAGEAVDDAKEAVAGEGEEEKEKFKNEADGASDDHMGR
ncbi:hypothetical protein AXF42_Ash017386 [Apostasia shenzhenica]|uniref:Uncharacterized protein n=1 Tax=Apostasia shenzhenica TaxID=1088818 RepID=A0A2I0BDI8_9ASPA|nr:hypothetical protein AXF42_Ash017386 [Apostasia shenzhenica]